MEVRRRKTQTSLHARKGSGDDKASKSASIDRKFTTCITLSFVLVISTFVGLFSFPQLVPLAVHKTVDGALSSFGLEEKLHAVVIDAGSTGSRVLAFSFHRGLFDGALRLDDELWYQVKPGLSSHADDPVAAAASIEQLLEKARERIPATSRATTPITLKATAGLRLLPKEKSEAILKEVEKTLVNSGFRPEKNLIEIMNPMEEGLFGWFTVNFLLDSFLSMEDSYLSLDLGGGSTQITFAPQKEVSGLEGRKHYIHPVSVLKNEMKAYSHSYLGLGLMAGREAIFKAGGKSDSLELNSPCILNSASDALKFTYQNKEYKLSSTANPSYESCRKVVSGVVKQGNVHTTPEITERNIAAFSYFFDEALANGMLPEGATEGAVKVGAYAEAARKACANPKSRFACADLTFIHALLSDGYGLGPQKEIQVYKKISGHEASWALGLAYNILERA